MSIGNKLIIACVVTILRYLLYCATAEGSLLM